MITDEMQLRPSYSEVDKMGYIYHANYVEYCHRARTELMRKMGVHDRALEDENIMLPVISFDIKYKKSGGYDELLTIKTRIVDVPRVRFNFEFEIFNEAGNLLSIAKSTLAFVKMDSRRPIPVPKFFLEILNKKIKQQALCN